MERYEQAGDRPDADPFSEQKDEIVALLREYRDMEQDEIIAVDENVGNETNKKGSTILVSVFVMLVVTLVTSDLVAKSIVKPLYLLGAAAKEIGQGNLDTRVKVMDKDQIGDLSRIFNTMADNLGQEHSTFEKKIFERTDELKKAKEGLDKTVEERTAELEKKLYELERMNAMMTGRELKMIELKKENEELKGKITGA